MKIFASELLRNFHHFPSSVLRFCFRHDGAESGVSDVNKLPLIVQVSLMDYFYSWTSGLTSLKYEIANSLIIIDFLIFVI